MKIFKVLSLVFLLVFFSAIYMQFVSANNYTVDIYFTISDTVYNHNEAIEIKGYVYQATYRNNGSLLTASTALESAIVNLTITNTNRTQISNYTFTTDNNGSFYSSSNFYSTAINVTSPSSEGDYDLRASYIDPNNKTWFSEVQFSVINQSIDVIRVSSEKAKYYSGETVLIEAEAIQEVGDNILYVANVSVNGTVQNSTKDILNNFTCTTGENGKCTTSITASSTFGDYIIELNNFKAFSSFSVTPFSYSTYMKDELGKSLKNVYALGEQATVEVSIGNASTSDVYTFTGEISDSLGNVVKLINTTELNSNNSFINTFLFTLDALTYSFGSYTATVTVTKQGDGSISSSTSFEVKDWIISVNKKNANSGFEYEYSVFPNKTMNFEAIPNYRSNGTVISNINSSAFTISIKDNLNNVVAESNTSWNGTCGNEGCYEFSITSPLKIGKYTLYFILTNEGSTQIQTRVIHVINNVISAQSTNKEGSLKELFGTNEYAYLSLTSHNETDSQVNVSDAEVFIVRYMNGTEYSYTEVTDFATVNLSNNVNEWAWNDTLQRLKIDVPRVGGVYNVFVYANNRTVGTLARFIVNPYEACVVPKDTAGDVTSGYYYVWQFKKTDTVYFEIKLTQANNLLGRASANNLTTTNSSDYGTGSACVIDTTTQQTINNATVSVLEVKNAESGSIQNINSTETNCQSSDSSGGYTCTVTPLDNWEGGVNIVKLHIQGQDGTVDIDYGRFESRAFYLYGWSDSWQVSPTTDVTLNVRLYEAGNGWWGSSSGLSGTISIKRIEYMGRDGEWIWPPVDSGYNVTNVSQATVTSGAGSLSIPLGNLPEGAWKTGYYRALIQGTTSEGDIDYGYAGFGVKLWDVYGTPVDCNSAGCNYKSYFNSKENITLFVKISPAGSYNYNYAGKEAISGNVSITVKKIEDCRSWPCKELNKSTYTADTIIVNESSPWYWNADTTDENDYLLNINTTDKTWGTGYYSVILDVNGTDTGRAWFNAIAFYVYGRPTNRSGSDYINNIKPAEYMYYNISVTKNYKGFNIVYNDSDYVNATIDDMILNSWDYDTGQNKEYNYPEDINVSIVGEADLEINGKGLINISYLNGSWPSGYYWGELTLKNIENETSSSRLWFEVRPFRVSTSTSTYNVDTDQCINATIDIYEPNWRTNTKIYGNFSITSVYEDVWSGSSKSRTSYSNYTTDSFNATTNITVCPDNENWGSGSWSGYHYLNLILKDNNLNDTQNGWLSFRAVPFSVSWGSIFGGSNKLTSANFVVPVTITKYSSGANSTGNLTQIYQWRYDSKFSGKEEYVFSVGNCFSNVSGQCTVNGTQNVTIYPNSRGWRVGYNYLYAEWTNEKDSSSNVRDYSGIYVEGREPYNGFYNNIDRNGVYKSAFTNTENITVQLNVRDSGYSNINVNITNVQYAIENSNCQGEWCLSYSDATWSLANKTGVDTLGGNAILDLQYPTNGWSLGNYRIRAVVSGSSGSATITGAKVYIIDLNPANITINTPVNNQSISDTSSFFFNATTSENGICSLRVFNYGEFYGAGYCGNVTTTTVTTQTSDACNITKFDYAGGNYYDEYVASSYHSTNNGVSNTWFYGNNGFVTGGTKQTYTFDASNWTAQHYGIQISCYDSDGNYGREFVAVYVNSTQNSTQAPPDITINFPESQGINYTVSNVNFNVTLNENGSCLYSLNSGAINLSMTNTNNQHFNATNSSIADGQYSVSFYCNDTSGNLNSTSRAFGVDSTVPLISFDTAAPADGANVTQNFIYVNISVTESNFNNVTYALSNSSAVINTSIFSVTLIDFLNWTGLVYTNYTYNVSVYDIAGNFNVTETRFVNLSVS